MKKHVLIAALLLSGCGWLPPLYGQTSTTAALRGDIVKLIKEDMKAKYNCDTIGVIDSQVKQKTKRMVVEEWTLNACRQSYVYDVVMTPDVTIPGQQGQKPTKGTAIQLVDRSAARK